MMGVLKTRAALLFPLAESKVAMMGARITINTSNKPIQKRDGFEFRILDINDISVNLLTATFEPLFHMKRIHLV